MFTTRKWWLLLVAALLPLSAHADGLLQNRFLAAGAGTPINNIGTAIGFHKITWNVSGTASVCTVALDTSADGITWSAGGAIAGQTCTSNGSSTVATVVANYVRMNMTALTVTPGSSVSVTWTGFVTNPGGGGGGGSVLACTTTGGVAFENGTNNTLTCDANLTWLEAAGGSGGFTALNTIANTGTGPVLAGGGVADWTVNSPNTTNADAVGWSGNVAAHGSGHFTGLVDGVTGAASFDGTGTVDELAANAAEPNGNTGGGTVTLSVGFDCGDQHGVSGVRNACFYAPDQGTGANDYAMYLAGGKAHSGGPIDSNGSISANSDGVHAGEVALLGQTTAPTIPANSFGFIGPNSASFTSWFIQPTSTAPAAQCMVSLGITASNISALTCPTLTPVANGGTALATLTAHALYVGNAASAPNPVSVGATGTVLAGSTGADPSFTATPAVTSIATGTSPPTCTVGTGGAHCMTEGTAPTGAASVDDIYADSTGHCLDAINNNVNDGCLLSVTNGATFPLTIVSGVSGGIPYFNSTTQESSSALLTHFGVLFGGGAGGAPTASAQGGLNFPLIGQGAANPIFSTITYPTTVTSGGVCYGSSTTAISCGAILNTNILVKGGGAGAAPTNSSITDDAKNITTSEVVAAGNKVFQAADFTDSTSGSLQLITNLTYTLPTSKAANYSFHCMLMYNQTSAAVVDQFGVGVTGTAPTQLNASGTVQITAGPPSTYVSGTLLALASTTPTLVVSFTPGVAATQYVATLDGTIEQPSNATPGVFSIYAFTTTGTDNLIVKRGSYCSVF